MADNRMLLFKTLETYTPYGIFDAFLSEALKPVLVVEEQVPKHLKTNDCHVVELDTCTLPALNERPSVGIPDETIMAFQSLLGSKLGQQEFRRKHPNLTAITLDFRIANRFYTFETVVVFYVLCKGIIPFGSSALPKRVGRFSTDVREGFYRPGGGKMRLRGYQATVRPGCSIGVEGGSAGTMGCFVEATSASTGLPNGILYLTNDHVVNTRNKNNPVHQPSYIDYVGYFSQKLAELEGHKHTDPDNAEIYDIEKEATKSMLDIASKKDTMFGYKLKGHRGKVSYSADGREYGIDAAIVHVESTQRSINPDRLCADTRGTLPSDFKLTGLHLHSTRMADEQIVYKVGRSSGLTQGRLSGVPMAVKSNNGFTIFESQKDVLDRVFKDQLLHGKNILPPVWLDNQICVTPIAAKNASFMVEGDSGGDQAKQITQLDALHLENKRLRDDLAETNKELAALKQSEGAVGTLKGRLAKYEAKLDEMVAEKVLQKELEMKQDQEEKMRIYKDA
ncbi:hypothetical protein HK102_005344, partial [Quaeritorhiza haematococci]